jgi:hypothetical protein
MYRRDRPTTNDFHDSECLYFRWFNDWLDGEKAIRPDNVPIPNQSVNRSRHGGKCWFVLLPEPAIEGDKSCGERARRQLLMGIVQIRMNGLLPPTRLDGKRYSFSVEHDPLDHNYQHCEIRVYQEGLRLTDKKSAGIKIVKKYYRVKVAKKAVLVLHPEIATRDGSN